MIKKILLIAFIFSFNLQAQAGIHRFKVEDITDLRYEFIENDPTCESSSDGNNNSKTTIKTPFGNIVSNICVDTDFFKSYHYQNVLHFLKGPYYKDCIKSTIKHTDGSVETVYGTRVIIKELFVIYDDMSLVASRISDLDKIGSCD